MTLPVSKMAYTHHCLANTSATCVIIVFDIVLLHETMCKNVYFTVNQAVADGFLST